MVNSDQVVGEYVGAKLNDDVLIHNWLSIELVLKVSLPRWFKGGIELAKDRSVGQQLPALIVQEYRSEVKDGFICVPLNDFRERFL